MTTVEGPKPAFEIIACPHPEYEAHPALAADQAVADIAELLRPWGGGAVDEWAIDEPRTRGRTDARLAYWQQRGKSANTVLVWIGHGGTDIDKRRAYLVVRGDEQTGIDGTIELETFAQQIENQQKERMTGAWSVVLVEACGGARFITQVLSRLREYETENHKRTLLIGSGALEETQFIGTLADGLRTALSQVTEDELPLRRLADLMRQIIEPDDRDRFAVDGLNLADSVLRRSVPGPVTAVWTDYRELRRALDALTADSDVHRTLMHYATKGTGTDLGEFAWRFVGQVDERREIFEWLGAAMAPDDTDHRVLIVCGAPGSGKSALLGSVLIDCRPEFASALNEVISGRTVELPEGRLPSFGLALHLTGATVRGTAAQVLASLDPGDGTPMADLITEVHRRARRRKDPLFVLADALDESAEPVALAHFFDELCRADAIRLVIGTRDGLTGAAVSLRSALLGRPARAERSAMELRPRVSDVVESLAVRIRDTELREQARAAAGLRFTAGHEGPPDYQFLWAAMAAEEINARSADLRAEPGLLGQLLAADHRTLFRLALDRLGKEVPLTHTVLFALAMAHGRGLPRQDRIWEETASAAVQGHEPVTYADVNAVLEAAGAYVMLDHDHGQGVYRLVHRVLQEELLSEADDLADRQLYAFRRLLGHVRPDAPLNAYLRSHLATHAGRAGPQAWAELAGRHDALDRLDPYAVATAALRSGRLSALPVEVRGTMTMAHRARDGGEDDRPGLRMLGQAWVEGGPALGPSANAPSTWSVRWSLLPRRPAHLAIGTDDREPGASALALLPVKQGRSLLAVAAGGQTVRIWDPVTGQPAGATFDLSDSHTVAPRGRGVAALVVFEEQGRPLLAGVPVGGQVVVWDPETGQRVADTVPSGAPVVGLAAYRAADGRPRLAVVRRNGAIERRDPIGGAEDGPAFGAGLGRLSKVVAVELPHTVVLVGLAQSGQIRAWDTRTGRAWGAGARLPGGGVDLALIEADAGRIVLAVIGRRGCHRCELLADADDEVDLADIELMFDTEAARLVDTVEAPDGRRLVVLADEYGEIRFRDPSGTGADVCGWHAHRGQIDALVANCPSDGEGWALATIAKAAGTTSVWPLDVFADPPLPDGNRQVLRVAVADSTVALAGRTDLVFVDAGGHKPSTRPGADPITGLIALGGDPGRLVVATRNRLWCWSAGAEDPEVWRHPAPVRAIAAAAGDDRGCFVTLDGHGVLRVWDTVSGLPRPATADTRCARTGVLACHWDGDDIVVAVGCGASVQRWRYRANAPSEWVPLPTVASAILPKAIAAIGADAGDPAALFVVTDRQIRCVAGDGADRWVEPAPTGPIAVDAWRTEGGRLRLAVANEVGEISLFDGTSGRFLRRIPTGLGAKSIRVAIQSDRAMLVIGASEGAVAIDLPAETGLGA